MQIKIPVYGFATCTLYVEAYSQQTEALSKEYHPITESIYLCGHFAIFYQTNKPFEYQLLLLLNQEYKLMVPIQVKKKKSLKRTKKKSNKTNSPKLLKQQLCEVFFFSVCTGGKRSQTVIGSLNNVPEYNNISTKADIVLI